MTKMKRVLALLLAVLMVAGLILVPVSAEGESTGGKSYQGMEVVDAGGVTEGTSGLVMSKYLVPDENGNHQLQLEVYTTGETVSSTIQVDAPTDIVLVLDQSGSMAWNIATTTYTAYIELTNSSLYSNKDNLWVKVGGEYKQATVTTKTTGDETYSALPNSTVNRTYSADWGSIGETTGGYYYYSENNNLYALVNGEYKAVKVEMSGNITNRSFTYSINEETIATSSGNDSVPNLGDYAPLYTKGEKLIYTYTYTDANGQTVTLATVEGQDGIYAATEGAGTDGELYSETSGTTPRLDALKTAVEKFADAVAEKAKGADGKLGTDDDINHRIAVVGFASDDSSYKNTELLTGVTITSTKWNGSSLNQSQSGTPYYFPTGYEKNGTQYSSLKSNANPYKSAFQNMDTTDGQNKVQDAIDALTAYGGTRTDQGMDMANQIFENNPIAAGETRNRVVIVFTDGIPTYDGKYSSSYANTAISNANIAKDTYGATVYTVGVFDNADENSAGSTGNNSSDADKGNYVCQQISSNNGVVPTGTAKKHYFAAKNTAALNNIFEQISQNIESSTTTTELGSETVVRDIVSSSFQLPEGATTEDITIETYSCTGVDESGNYTWKNNNNTMNAAASINGKTVDVTGFNFKENYVYATNSSNARGSKLVITIPIEDKGTAMGQVSTNDASSGVYENSDATEYVAPFKQPIVNFPYFQVGHIESKVDTTGEKTGTIGANYGEQNGELEKYRVHENTPFNLVSKVTDGYLYGGAFSDAACGETDVQMFENDENALSYTPKADAVYYIWEVPESYLPANIYTMHKENGEGVTRIYMLTATDRALYREVGFDLGATTLVSGTADSGIANKDGEITNLANGVLYGTIQVTKMSAAHEEVYLNSSGNNKAGKMMTTGKTGFLAEDAYHDEGCIGGYRLPQDVFTACQDTVDGFTFQSYWVTLDGIKVYGLNQAQVTYASGDMKAKIERTPNSIDPTYVGTGAEGAAVQLMAFAPVAVASDEEIETAINLTVHDNGSVYTQSADETLCYAGAEGKLFAGWFLDEDYTTPVDFESISESTDVYAKYVSDAYLQVKYNKLGLFRVSGVSLVSAVDKPASYAEVGILVNGEPVSVSQSQRYMLLFTAASLFDGASRSDTLLTAQLSLSGSGSLEVTPYWVTLDGTTVYGQSRTLTYTARSIQG